MFLKTLFDPPNHRSHTMTDDPTTVQSDPAAPVAARGAAAPEVPVAPLPAVDTQATVGQAQDTAGAPTPVPDNSATADANTPVKVLATPSTDTTVASATGGPTPGLGAVATPPAAHNLLTEIETELRAELQAVEQMPEHVWHVVQALFDRKHSEVDARAAS